VEVEVTEARDGSVGTSVSCPEEGCDEDEMCENHTSLENGVLTNSCSCSPKPLDTAVVEEEDGVVYGCGVPVDLTAACHQLSPVAW